MRKHCILAMLVAAGVLAVGAKAGTITTSSAGTTLENWPSASGGFDVRGDTVTSSALHSGLLLTTGPFTVTFDFVSPVTEVGFDIQFSTAASVTAVTLSNGDTFAGLPRGLSTTPGYLGFISTLNGGFTSATFTASSGNSTELSDFRITAAAAPEPETWAFIAPALLACVAVFRLRKR
jgi:hypothetical protein